MANSRLPLQRGLGTLVPLSPVLRSTRESEDALRIVALKTPSELGYGI
jgi:hypothetical protein